MGCSGHVCCRKSRQIPQPPQLAPCVQLYLVTFEEGREGIRVTLGPSASVVASISPDGWTSGLLLSTYPPFTRHGLCRRENALSGWRARRMRDLRALSWMFFSWKADCLLGPPRLEPGGSRSWGWHRGGSWLGKEQGVGLLGCQASPGGNLCLRRLLRNAHSQGGDNERGEHACSVGRKGSGGGYPSA